MNRSCGPSALLVGAKHRLPADPCEYNGEYSIGPGCNNLRCEACGARVRSGPPGSRLKDGQGPGFIARMHETADWATLPYVGIDKTGWRLYACKCRYWQEGSEHLLVNDHDSAGDPDLPWVCGGHPAPELPVTLGELTISTESDWPSIVERILGGACPRPLERQGEGPAAWLSWLGGYLRGLPVEAALSRAVGDRVDDREARIVGAVLLFFRRFPAAEGIDRVIARAESDLAGVFVPHKIPEQKYRPSVWDVLIAALQQRSHENDAIDVRVLDVVRKIMLAPAPEGDPIKDTLTKAWLWDAWRDDDFTWFAENIEALEAAGAGRWTPVMNLIAGAGRKNKELEHLTLLAGGALIQSGRVPHAEIGAWLQEFAYREVEGWVITLEAMLQKSP